jgi:hypothetical protein
VAEDATDRLRQAYLWFADHEASGRSPLYVELAQGVAGDRQLLSVLTALPPAKQQPNLLFTVVRYLCGEPRSFSQFREWAFDRREEVLALTRSRRTQTNEPARCATLLPLLARLPQPLALIEVGAAAGLCLLIDRYGYDYGRCRVPAPRSARDAPVFSCRANRHTPLPTQGVEVAWRTGLDLEPIDVGDPEQVAWLEALVWPGEGRRLELLRAAIAVARADPPRLVRGDLRRDLRGLVEQAPGDATLVVFHTAVLAYLAAPAERIAFGNTVRELGARWISNEGAGVLEQPGFWPSGPFVLSLDGEPVARTDPHGTFIDWMSEATV